MKRQVLTLVSALGLLLMAGSAYAQTVNLRANVPFNFIVRNATLPAGTYTISSISSALSIRSEPELQAVAMVLANGVESLKSPAQSKLVFHRVGNQYFLAQIWTAGSSSGREIPMSRREAELVAKNYSVTEETVLAQLR